VSHGDGMVDSRGRVRENVCLMQGNKGVEINVREECDCEMGEKTNLRRIARCFLNTMHMLGHESKVQSGLSGLQPELVILRAWHE